MKRLFVSQPMKDLTDDEIVAERNRIILKAQEALVEAVDPIPSLHQMHDEMGKHQSLFCLANAIYALAEADVAVFAKGWEKARRCRIEHEICLEYGIDIVEIYSD